jgi:hypothetical protein
LDFQLRDLERREPEALTALSGRLQSTSRIGHQQWTFSDQQDDENGDVVSDVAAPRSAFSHRDAVEHTEDCDQHRRQRDLPASPDAVRTLNEPPAMPMAMNISGIAAP